MIKYHSHSVKETEQFGREFAKRLKGGEVIGLVGELGSGKTSFVRGMAEGLGIDPRSVLSPTFTLVHEYSFDRGRRPSGGWPSGQWPCRLIHVDLYRLEKEKELAGLGLEEYLTPENVVVVEWGDRLPSDWQKEMTRLFFEIFSKEERVIKEIPHGK